MTETTTHLGPIFRLIMINSLLLIGLPYLIAGVLTIINHATKERLARWHPSAQLVVGGLGVFIHELSHAIACLLFAHQITDIQLINFNLRDNPDHSLGHVSHRYRPGKIWPMLGNLWIGLAPIFGCTISIIGLTWLLARPTLTIWWQFALNPDWQSAAIMPLFTSLLTTTSPLALILWLLLGGMIAVGGFDLSTADFKGTIPGTLATLGLVIILTGLCQLIGQPNLLTNWLLQLAIPMSIISLIALGLSGITWLIVTGLFTLRFSMRH